MFIMRLEHPGEFYCAVQYHIRTV